MVGYNVWLKFELKGKKIIKILIVLWILFKRILLIFFLVLSYKF